MTEFRELFINFLEDDLDLHIELGDNTKYVVRGQGTMQLQFDSGGSFDAEGILYVPGQ
jgi:hypothetical protein